MHGLFFGPDDRSIDDMRVVRSEEEGKRKEIYRAPSKRREGERGGGREVR